MHGTDENGAEQHPEQCWQPSPKHGDGGPDDWARASDAREMMPEDNLLFGRNVVDIVAQFLTRHLRVCI